MWNKNRKSTKTINPKTKKASNELINKNPKLANWINTKKNEETNEKIKNTKWKNKTIDNINKLEKQKIKKLRKQKKYNDKQKKQ